MALLTVDELRKHLTDYPTGADYDDALARLLEAAEATIDTTAGALGEVTQYVNGGTANLVLDRPASAFTSVTEMFGSGSPLVLDEDDYRLSPSGYTLNRLTTGPNAAFRWSGTVEVVYTPIANTAEREMVAILLVQQFVAYHPGLSQETIGDWSQTFASNSVWNWSLERDAILATLHTAPSMRVI